MAARWQMRSLAVWQALSQPSLARRLVLAALLAFGLVGGVLMTSAFSKYQKSASSHDALLTACRHLSEALLHARTDEQARVVAQAAETYFNASRQAFGQQRHRPLDPLLFELTGRHGELLHASAHLQGTRLQMPAGPATQQVIHGRSHWGCRAEFAGGAMQLAEPELPTTTVLSWIGADLLPDLLLAFPFVMVPVWIAVHQGLRPLRRLAGQLERRSSDDFSPIDVKPQHAELRPLIQAFDAVLARLRDAVQRERAFVQDAAHELRTPMAVISAQAHVLAQAGSAAERQQAGAAMDHAIARASHLSQQLLALASLDEHCRLEPRTVDLVALTEQALAGTAAEARARGLELSLEAPEHLTATLDVAAFQSVLHNLLDNAMRYVPPGGQVEVSLRAGAPGWHLRVADDGPGIPADEQAHIFERFVRGRQASASGTGLGLAIVRQAARRLGGELRLQAGLHGRGVAFELSVPGL